MDGNITVFWTPCSYHSWGGPSVHHHIIVAALRPPAEWGDL